MSKPVDHLTSSALQNGRTQNVDQPHAENAFRSAGVTARPHRLKDQLIRAKEQYARQGYSTDEIKDLIESDFPSELLSDRQYLRFWESLQQISSTVTRSLIDPLIEAAAVLRIPGIAWLRSTLETHEGPGRKASRLPVATLFSMAIEGGSPNVKRAAQEFKHSYATRGWAYGLVDICGLSSMYETLHSAAERRDPDSILHVQIDLLRQLADLVETPQDKALGFNDVRPRVGEILVVDGTQQQADVQQVFPVNEEHAAFLDGNYENLGYIRYVRDQREIKRNHGQNIVVISDMATGLPIVYGPFPAGFGERKAATQLLEVLFKIWPDCPAKFLVGDSLYDHSKKFARELEIRWSLHPVFPMHGARGDTSEYAATNGVPTCPHGFMSYSPEGFWTGEQRAAKGFPRGTRPPISEYNPRIRCECQAENPQDRCKPVYLRVREDPLWSRYIPMAGPTRLRKFGAAMMAHRNSVESIFALMQMLGYWGPKSNRPKWAKSRRESCWAYMLPLLMLTAKRLAHVSGLYDEMFDRATALDQLTPPRIDHPAPGPSVLSMAADLERMPINPPPPETWSNLLRADPSF